MSEAPNQASIPVFVIRATTLVVIGSVISVLQIASRSLSEEAPAADVMGESLGAVGLPLVLAYLSFKGRNWARVLLAFLIASSIAFWFLIPALNKVASTACFAAAMVMYFLPSSNAWYREKKDVLHRQTKRKSGKQSVLTESLARAKFAWDGIHILIYAAAGGFIIMMIVIQKMYS